MNVEQKKEVLLVPLAEKWCEEVYRIAVESIPEHWSLQGIRDVLKYDYNIFYVAVDAQKDKAVGFAGIMILMEEAELLNIAVTGEYRKCGIAQKLLSCLLQEAEQRRVDRMLLEVRESNMPARSLYEKNGFSAIALRKEYYNNPQEDAVIMEKWIS